MYGWYCEVLSLASTRARVISTVCTATFARHTPFKAVIAFGYLAWTPILRGDSKRLHARDNVPCTYMIYTALLRSQMIFAMLIRLVLDGAGLGFDRDFGGEYVSGVSCTRLTGLCSGG
jgi:hypothetical protein